MSRSAQEARQELERLKSMYAALPDKRDSAAEDIAEQIRRVEAELAGHSGNSGGGFSLPIVALIAGGVLAVALIAGYLATALMG